MLTFNHVIASNVAKRANSINVLVVYFDSIFMLRRYFAIFSCILFSYDGVHVQLRRSARAAPTELHEMRVLHMN